MKSFIYHGLVVLLSFFTAVKSTVAAPANEVELRSIPNSIQKQGIIRHVLQGSLEEVWETLIDVDHYTETMPRNDHSDLIEKKPDYIRYSARINMPFPISDVQYECELFLKPDRRHMDFNMVKGTGKGVKNFYGQWDLKPVSPTETYAEYKMVYEPEVLYPQWVMNLGLKSTLGNVMKKLQDHLDNMHGKK